MTLDLSLLPDGGVRWLDASGQHADVVLSTRVRLARNVDGYAFAARARDGERLRVLAQVREALQHLPMPQSFMVRVDELVACRQCRKRFELTGQSVVLMGSNVPAPNSPDFDPENFGNR